MGIMDNVRAAFTSLRPQAVEAASEAVGEFNHVLPQSLAAIGLEDVMGEPFILNEDRAFAAKSQLDEVFGSEIRTEAEYLAKIGERFPEVDPHDRAQFAANYADLHTTLDDYLVRQAQIAANDAFYEAHPELPRTHEALGLGDPDVTNFFDDTSLALSERDRLSELLDVDLAEEFSKLSIEGTPVKDAVLAKYPEIPQPALEDLVEKIHELGHKLDEREDLVRSGETPFYGSQSDEAFLNDNPELRATLERHYSRDDNGWVETADFDKLEIATREGEHLSNRAANPKEMHAALVQEFEERYPSMGSSLAGNIATSYIDNKTAYDELQKMSVVENGMRLEAGTTSAEIEVLIHKNLQSYLEDQRAAAELDSMTELLREESDIADWEEQGIAQVEAEMRTEQTVDIGDPEYLGRQAEEAFNRHEEEENDQLKADIAEINAMTGPEALGKIRDHVHEGFDGPSYEFDCFESIIVSENDTAVEMAEAIGFVQNGFESNRLSARELAMYRVAMPEVFSLHGDRALAAVDRLENSLDENSEIVPQSYVDGLRTPLLAAAKELNVDTPAIAKAIFYETSHELGTAEQLPDLPSDVRERIDGFVFDPDPEQTAHDALFGHMTEDELISESADVAEITEELYRQERHERHEFYFNRSDLLVAGKQLYAETEDGSGLHITDRDLAAKVVDDMKHVLEGLGPNDDLRQKLGEAFIAKYPDIPNHIANDFADVYWTTYDLVVNERNVSANKENTQTDTVGDKVAPGSTLDKFLSRVRENYSVQGLENEREAEKFVAELQDLIDDNKMARLEQGDETALKDVLEDRLDRLHVVKAIAETKDTQDACELAAKTRFDIAYERRAIREATSTRSNDHAW